MKKVNRHTHTRTLTQSCTISVIFHTDNLRICKIALTLKANNPSNNMCDRQLPKTYMEWRNIQSNSNSYSNFNFKRWHCMTSYDLTKGRETSSFLFSFWLNLNLKLYGTIECYHHEQSKFEFHEQFFPNAFASRGSSNFGTS